MPPGQERNQRTPRASIDKYIDGLSHEVRQQMAPLIEDSIRVYDWAVERLSQNGLTPTTADILLKGNIKSGDNPIDADIAFKHELAAEFRYIIYHVVGTSLSLKKFMVEQHMPERVIAYQSGTGFPLPDEIEGKVEKKGMLKFSEGILEFIPKADHKRDGRPNENESQDEPPAGLHFYEVTADNGRKMTLIAVKGRYHGYSAIASKTAYPHHLLATLPRVLKGIGVESVLATFASGYDGIPIEGQATPATGDYGYILNVTDLSGESAITHPGKGIQSILAPLTGGPFMTTTAHASDKMKMRLMEKAITLIYPDKKNDGQSIPGRHVALAYDCGSNPNFEHPGHWAQARVLSREVIETPGMVDEEKMAEVDSSIIATIQGMSMLSEIDNYNQFLPTVMGGFPSVYNRKVPVLAMAGFTDAVDPRIEGQSHQISDEAVREAGRKGTAFIAPVISEYAIQTATLYTPQEKSVGLENELLGIDEDPEDKQGQLDRMLLVELRAIGNSESVEDLYQTLINKRKLSIEIAARSNQKQTYAAAILYDQLAARLAEKMGIEFQGFYSF